MNQHRAQGTRPTVGRVVHYVSFGTPGGEYSSECRAAIVTEVADVPHTIGNQPAGSEQLVSLCVLNPTGQFFNRGVAHDERPVEAEHPDRGNGVRRGGTWHWPERTDASTA